MDIKGNKLNKLSVFFAKSWKKISLFQKILLTLSPNSLMIHSIYV